jgi:hypothetical protein
MRTVIFIGLLMIGGALRELAGMEEVGYYKFFAYVTVAVALMDIIEFVHNINKNKE